MCTAGGDIFKPWKWPQAVREWLIHSLNAHAFVLVPRRVGTLRQQGVLRFRSFHEIRPSPHCRGAATEEFWALALAPDRLRLYGTAFNILSLGWTIWVVLVWQNECVDPAFWAVLASGIQFGLPCLVFWFPPASRYVFDREVGELLAREGRSWLAGVTPRYPWKPRCGSDGCRGPGRLQYIAFWFGWHTFGEYWHRGPRLFGPAHPAHVAARTVTRALLDPDRRAAFTLQAFWLWYVCYPVWGIALALAGTTVLFMPVSGRYLLGLGFCWLFVSVAFAILERYLMERDIDVTPVSLGALPFTPATGDTLSHVETMQGYVLAVAVSIMAILLLMIFQMAQA